MAYDGMITFDTHIDTAGFSDGVRKLSDGFDGVSRGAEQIVKQVKQ